MSRVEDDRSTRRSDAGRGGIVAVVASVSVWKHRMSHLQETGESFSRALGGAEKL